MSRSVIDRDRARERAFGKLLAAVLRHQPELAGVALDARGWADVAALLSGLEARGTPLTRDELAQVVERCPKRRFALSEDGARVRAHQGHTVPVVLDLFPRTPPDVLLHGTGRGALEAIMQEGLRPMGRSHAHLSEDRDAAWQVAQRAPGKAVLLAVDAKGLAGEGQVFLRTENGVWLTAGVPPRSLRVLPRGATPRAT